MLILSNLIDREKIYGVFTKKGNCHDKFLMAFETEDEAINYIKEKADSDRIMFYREMKGQDIHYWLCIYDKK